MIVIAAKMSYFGDYLPKCYIVVGEHDIIVLLISKLFAATMLILFLVFLSKSVSALTLVKALC